MRRILLREAVESVCRRSDRKVQNVLRDGTDINADEVLTTHSFVVVLTIDSAHVCTSV